MPKISIIVPVYKVEEYLSICVDSLCKQTMQDIEIILVDDGSPDACGEMCDEYAKQDDRVRVIHQENGGLSCARNTGAKYARGEYLCFVDSDDYVALDYCETLYKLLKDTDCDYSVCGACRFEDGEVPQPIDNHISGQFLNAEFLEMQITKRTEFGVWNKLYRKEVFEKIQFMEGKLHEDVIWSADLAHYCSGGVISTEKQLYYYRQRNSGIMGKGAKKCSPDRIFAGEYLVETVKQVCPDIYRESLKYAVDYPWMYIDSIYLKKENKDNKKFLDELQKFLQSHIQDYITYDVFSKILLSRMKLFAKSKKLYAWNVFGRLFRVYICRLLHIDAYKSGHGI